ncbi:hypothetical protein GOBAR_DD27211 [Gossypium barbadense]|nr:hypothetical protein GOBAR_DD27211 [Gossypium barbadense]
MWIGILQELQIEFSQYEHPVVLTVEAQAKYVGNLGGALSKKFVLEGIDKKHRYYVVSALADTKVDLKATESASILLAASSGKIAIHVSNACERQDTL